ncbi:hemojuvelin [Aplochiton taeniatus]
MHLLLLLLCCRHVWASCRILRCNSDFVAATLDLGTGGGGGGGGSSREGVNAGYCSALRSYAQCTRRTSRACRGDLAYHSAVQGIEDLLFQHHCPRAGPTAQPRPLPQAPLSGDGCLYERGLVQHHGGAPEYLHCGVFGDPHVRTFNDHFHTCSVPGAWPLIDNDYLYIQATSTPLEGGAKATALTKITIIFKDVRQCLRQQIYQAELDNVPGAFTDGSVSSGQRWGQDILSVRSQSPGRHAEIRALHMGSVLVVRQSGLTLGLTVRCPRAVVQAFSPQQDLQLCVWGCPASQRLDTSSSSSSSSWHAAQAHCASLLPTRDVYQQACVFDLLAAGELNSSLAALAALQDAQDLMADPGRLHLLPVGASSQPTPSLWPLLAWALLVEYLVALWR